MSFDVGTGALADSAGRALGSVINKLKVCKELGYSTYTQLYQACVSPILNYAAGVWGSRESKVIDAIQNRAIRLSGGAQILSDPSDSRRYGLGPWNYSTEM